MKKLLFLLALASPVFADIAVTPGVGKTVATQTNSSREYQGIVVADPGGISTMTVTSGGAALVTSSGIPVSQQGTWTVQPGNTQNITTWLTVSTYTYVVNLTTVTFNGTAQPVSQSGNWPVQPPAVTTVSWQNQGAQTVTSTSTVITSTYPVNVTVTSTASLNTAITNSPTVNPGNTQNSTAWQTISTYTYIVNITTVSNTSNSLVVTSSQSNNNAANAANRLNVLPSIAQTEVGNNGAAYTLGRDAAMMTLNKTGTLGVSQIPEFTFPGYSASTGTFTIAQSSADVAIICGNASSTTFVTSIRVACTQTTAGIIPISIAKRSSAYTNNAVAVSSIWSTMTAVAQDSNYSTAGSSVVYNIAANNTINGTLVGYIDYGQIGCMAAATASPNDIYISPSDWKQKPIVLRGATQCLGINFEGASMSGAKITATFDWFESVSP